MNEVLMPQSVENGACSNKLYRNMLKATLEKAPDVLNSAKTPISLYSACIDLKETIEEYNEKVEGASFLASRVEKASIYFFNIFCMFILNEFSKKEREALLAEIEAFAESL